MLICLAKWQLSVDLSISASRRNSWCESGHNRVGYGQPTSQPSHPYHPSNQTSNQANAPPGTPHYSLLAAAVEYSRLSPFLKVPVPLAYTWCVYAGEPSFGLIRTLMTSSLSLTLKEDLCTGLSLPLVLKEATPVSSCRTSRKATVPT